MVLLFYTDYVMFAVVFLFVFVVFFFWGGGGSRVWSLQQD